MRSQRLMVRTPFFTVLPEYLIVLLMMAFLILAFTATASAAPAEGQTTTTTSKRVRKSTTTITTVHEEGDDVVADVPTSTTTSTASTVEEGEVTTTFGSKATTGTAGCKTEELNKAVIRDLKSDCKAWVKDQRADLKGKFNTSKCEEACTDCGTSLQRCTVTGTVKYRK